MIERVLMLLLKVILAAVLIPFVLVMTLVLAPFYLGERAWAAFWNRGAEFERSRGWGALGMVMVPVAALFFYGGREWGEGGEEGIAPLPGPITSRLIKLLRLPSSRSLIAWDEVVSLSINGPPIVCFIEGPNGRSVRRRWFEAELASGRKILFEGSTQRFKPIFSRHRLKLREHSTPPKSKLATSRTA